MKYKYAAGTDPADVYIALHPGEYKVMQDLYKYAYLYHLELEPGEAIAELFRQMLQDGVLEEAEE